MELASFFSFYKSFFKNHYKTGGEDMKRTLKAIIPITLVVMFIFPKVIQAGSLIQEEIMYKILVDRYNIGEQQRSDQVRIDDPYAFHGGDLKGLIARLGTIESLGYTAITISPIMENEKDGYHGYWISDFFSIDEQFGMMEDLHTLIEEAKKRDIKIILELVTNFVSKNHPFMKDPEKNHWFKTVEVPRKDSTYWLEDVVQLKQDEPEVQDYLLEVIDFWIEEVNLAGFNLHAVDQMDPDFLRKVIDHIQEKDDSFYLFGTILDDSTNYEYLESFADDLLIASQPMHETLIDVFSELGKPVADLYETWEKTGKHPIYMYVDDEHTKRFSQLVAENGRNPMTAWKLALTYMYTSPGVPVIFQGSEFMMFGDGFPETQRLLPFHSAEQELEQFFYRMASLKKEFPIFSKGSFELVGSDGAMSVFKRSFDGDSIYIAINNDDRLRKVKVTDIDEGKRLRGIIEDNLVLAEEDGSYILGIPRESVEVYLIEEDVGINWLFISFVAGVFLIFVLAVVYLSYKQKARSSK